MSAKKSNQQYLRSREQGFDLSGVYQQKLPQYNALLDRNLRHHFESGIIQNHLNTIGLIDSKGRIIDLEKQKGKLSIIEQEFKLAEKMERRKEKEEEEIRRRVQMRRHEAIQEVRRKERLEKIKEEQKIAREIIQAARGIYSPEKPTARLHATK